MIGPGKWDPRGALTRVRERLRASWVKGPVSAGLYEFLAFGIKQAWACLFGAAMLALLILTHVFWPEHAPLARYDFLTLAALVLQAGLIALRLETWEEARVILAFHLVGTAMEIFKTAAGSWHYPEPSLLRIAGVPLFSGFMYASVGSYLARVWRIFAFEFRAFPPLWAMALLSIAIYANFFAHHVLPDFRLGLFALAAILFWRTRVDFRSDRSWRSMPLLLGFFLVAGFIWLAENAATYAHAWIYPSQQGQWIPVSVAKLGSWYLLMIISFTLVSSLHHAKSGANAGDEAGKRDA